MFTGEDGLKPGGKWGAELPEHWSWCVFEGYPSAVNIGARQISQIRMLSALEEQSVS